MPSPVMTRPLATLAALVLLITTSAAQQMRFEDVVRNLRNPDPDARMAAVEMLRESRHLEAIVPIAPLVNDPVDAIQLAAIDTELSFHLVDEISSRRRVALIVEVRSGGKAERAFASGPLAVWPRPVPAVLLAALLSAVDDENQKVRLEAIYTFGAIARAPLAAGHSERLIKALDHYDPAIRMAAARVAGRLQVRSAGEALIRTVNDSQASVRFAAMRALGEVGETAAVTALAQQLDHYRKGEGAFSALDGLARIGHASSIPAFTARLGDRDPFLRRLAAEGLGRAGATAQTTALETLAGTDESAMVRAAAAFALQKLGRPYVARLAASLNDDRLVQQIAGYFFELGPPVAPELAPHLRDPDAGVRGNAALILGAIGGDAEIRALEPLRQDRERDVVRAAERAIERIRMRRASEAGQVRRAGLPGAPGA